MERAKVGHTTKKRKKGRVLSIVFCFFVNIFKQIIQNGKKKGDLKNADTSVFFQCVRVVCKRKKKGQRTVERTVPWS